MLQELTILKVERKTSKTNKPYLLIDTEKGKFGCWNPAIFDSIKEGQRYEFQTETTEAGFSNILGMEKELGTPMPAPAVRDDKLNSMRESYAKDILIALIEMTKEAKTRPELDVLASAAALSVLKIKDVIAGK